MAEPLTGKTPGNTYTWLLQMQGNGSTLDAVTPIPICFGDGTETPISITTTGLFVGGVAVATDADIEALVDLLDAKVDVSEVAVQEGGEIGSLVDLIPRRDGAGEIHAWGFQVDLGGTNRARLFENGLSFRPEDGPFSGASANIFAPSWADSDPIDYFLPPYSGTFAMIADVEAVAGDIPDISGKANLAGGNTFSGAQSFSNQLEATGQAATNGTSLMTRALCDARYSLPKVSAYKNTTQALSAGVDTKILFQTELFDTHNCFASSTFTAPVACFVQVSCALYFSGTAGIDAISIRKNGTQIKRLINHSMSDPWQAGGTALIQCAANDTIEIYGYAQNGRSVLDAETISWVTFAVIP